MIPLIAGWTWSYEEDTYTLTAPSSSGVITYQERLRPLATTTAIVRSVMARDPSVRWDPPAGIERLLSHEGEHAAMTVLHGRREDSLVSLVAAIVFGDDFYSLLLGRSSSETSDMAEVIRSLVIADSHSLGIRRRRYEFAPPEGWGGFSMLFHAVYLHPGFPHEPTMITVYPALPRLAGSGEGPETLAAILTLPHMPFAAMEHAWSTPIKSRLGLTGAQYELAGSLTAARGTRLLAVLEDERYLYPLALDTSAASRADTVRVFEPMIASIVPVPAPRSATAAHSTLAAIWNE